MKFKVPQILFNSVIHEPNSVRFTDLYEVVGCFKKIPLTLLLKENVNNRFTLVNKGDNTSVEAKFERSQQGVIYINQAQK